MTEAEARALLLVRAFDSAAAADVEDDPARAPRAAARLAERDPAAAAALRAATWPRGLGTALAVLAVAAGVALDSLGTAGRIHLLSAPLGLLAWNMAIYALLAVQALRALTQRGAPSRPGGPLREALRRALHRLATRHAAARPVESTRFLADWAALARPLHRERVARLLHVGAAALAAGLLASLYLRGLFLEYRAGWDSTFLTPAAVHRLLSVVLWPALQLTGGTLPAPEALAQLRFSAGGGENAARWIHWIALTVGLVVVLPRALLAAAAGARAARLARALPGPATHAAAATARPAARAAAPRAVRVLPYSYRPPAGCEEVLRTVLIRRLGGPVAVRLEAPLPLGAEETPEAWRRARAASGGSDIRRADDERGGTAGAVSPFAGDGTVSAGGSMGTGVGARGGGGDGGDGTGAGGKGRPGRGDRSGSSSNATGTDDDARDAGTPGRAGEPMIVPLFALTATPERETHGAFLDALFETVPSGEPRALLVDESGFRRRFAGPEGETRLAARRAAWQRLADAADAVAWFEDLTRPAGTARHDGAAAAAGGAPAAHAASPGREPGR